MLTRVMENLLGNAWKYSSRSPQAHIAFRGVPHADGPTAFQVIDNGVGFDMRLAGQLFGPFQRLHSASEFPGHGVGLVTVKRIVERHGGQVGAHSEPGQGSMFWFTLAERAADKVPRDPGHDQALGTQATDA
jgi:signal transduction histidine kinase